MHLRLWANDTARQNGIPQVAAGTNKSNSDAAMNSTQQINSNKPKKWGSIPRVMTKISDKGIYEHKRNQLLEVSRV
ncbi:MAG: hypothetical protein M3P08_01775 [Thermoproteota archaeon]|nr:hypothetical protein [Thermoproteota archaeon]